MKKVKIEELMQILESSEHKIIIVDFYADWCGPCKRLDPILVNFQENNEDILILKIDIDESPSAAEKFEITSIPNLIFFVNGIENGRHTGIMSEEELQETVERMKLEIAKENY